MSGSGRIYLLISIDVPGGSVVHLKGNAQHSTNPTQIKYIQQFFTHLTGDLNQNSEMDILDVVLMVGMIMECDHNSNADLNYDGIVNVLDVILFVNLILDE